MGHQRELQKFAQLRAKTDRQLQEMIDKGLDRGFTFSGLASAYYFGNRALADRFLVKAQRICEESGNLLPKIYRLNQAEKKRLEGKLEELRRELDAMFEQRPIARTACC